MQFEIDEELCKNWPEFYKFAEESLKSHEYQSSSAEDTSLFLSLIHSQKLKLYEECGFETKASEKLDELIRKTEQICLMETIQLYENFKQTMSVKHMTSCVVKMDRIKEFTTPVQSKGSKKVAKRRQSSRAEKTPSSDTEEETVTLDDQELGRGKRKKIRKLKFEIEEESPFSLKAKGTTTPQNVSYSSKKVCHSEPPKKKSPMKANESIRKNLNRAITHSKRTSPANLSAKKLEQRKKQLNSKKLSKAESKNSDSSSKSPEKSKQDSPAKRTKVERGEETIDLDMSVDTEASLVDKTSGQTNGEADIDKSKDLQHEAIENSAEGDPSQTLKAESSEGKVKDEGCPDTDESTLSDGASKEGGPAKVIRFKRVRGPQRAPKKLPLNKIPMVCAYCKARFAAYSTLRRHWERVHSEDNKFDATNPPKLLLCIECGEEFNFVNLYLRHYRAHFASASSDQEQVPHQANGSGEKADNEESRENSTLEGEGNVSTSEDNKQNASATDDHLATDTANQDSLNGKIDEDTKGNFEDEKKVKPRVKGPFKKVSNVYRSRKGRGPQKTPKKFPWSLVPIVCAECKTRYSTYSTLRRHWTKCHSVDKKFDRANPPKLMLCTVCDETFNWPRQFLKHYREHAAKEELSHDTVRPVKFIGERTDFPCDKMVPITCSVCKIVINGEGVIYSHWKKEHKTEPDEKPPPLFYCDQCGLSFDAPRKFRLHYRIHTGAKPHECEVCQKTFRTFSDLTSHMLCHNQSKEHRCEICGKAFIAQKILNRHMKGHLFPHVCDVCGKSYPSKYSLNLHAKIHTGEKPHKCEFCGVAFIQAGSLKLHRRLHLGDKPHVCDTCGMRFNSMSHLKTHVRVHTGEKPYKCDQCNYAAASSSRLKDHATVHKEDKPHVCKVPGCGRRYKRLSHLIFHHSKHAGVKPYVCKICGASFKLSSALTLHKRQDACALHLKEGVKPEFPEDQTKENIGDYSLLLSKPEDAVDNTEELKEETQTVYIYHDIEEQDGLQELGDAGQQIIGIDGATHTEFKLEGQVEGQEEYEQQIVIQIVREPGHEDEDIVLSKEELERIVRLSQQI